MRENNFVPDDARKMHKGIYRDEEITLPDEITIFAASFQREFAPAEVAELQVDAEANSLVTDIEAETLIVEEAIKEQITARTLGWRFGIPYMPGAEEVWLIIGKHLATAKEVTEQAQSQLRQTINHIQALLISQVNAEHEDQIRELELEENEQRKGISTLYRASTEIAGEDDLANQNNAAITQKEKRIAIISIQKREIRDSIQSIRAMVSTLLLNFSHTQQLDSAQLVMA